MWKPQKSLKNKNATKSITKCPHWLSAESAKSLETGGLKLHLWTRPAPSTSWGVVGYGKEAGLCPTLGGVAHLHRNFKLPEGAEGWGPLVNTQNLFTT